MAELFITKLTLNRVNLFPQGGYMVLQLILI